MDCIFCKIISGDIPSNKVYEDEDLFAFHDISPQAKTHVLIIPKKHINSAAEIDESNSALVAKIFETAAKLSKDLGLDGGFRIVTNCGDDGAQSVKHLHFHLLGGEKLSGKMG